MLGTKKVAEILGLAQSYICRLCREGAFPNAEHDGSGSPWRIPEGDVKEYLSKIRIRKTGNN